MAARHVMDAAVLARRVVEARPAREVRERRRPRPVGIVLVPRDHAAVARGLAEQLVVPEAHRAAEELRRRHGEARVPQQVVERGRDAPRVCRFVRVVFVEELPERVARLHQPAQLGAQTLDLLGAQHAHARQITVLAVELDLLARQPTPLPLLRRRGSPEEVCQRLVIP